MALEFRPFSEQQQAFYSAYGGAMAHWNGLEDELGNLFIAITGMPEKMGRDVYFSVGSFAGRADMLMEAGKHAKTVPEGRRYIAEVVGLAKR